MPENIATDAVLTTQNLAIGYVPVRQHPRVVAENISVTLKPGEFVCLLGPNGAGKSTLLRTLVGMQKPLSGHVYLSGKDITTLSAQQRAQLLSVVLTERVQAGILSARDLVALGRYPYTDWTGRLTQKDEEIITWAIQSAGAQPLAHRNVAELSDGERQKIMIARALAQQPDLMVLDEPTAYLDLPRRVEIMALLQTLAHTTNKTMLLSTHDLDLALRCADRIWLLPQGGPLLTGAPEDLVLNGAFETAFQSKNVHFDAHTGAFKINTQNSIPIGLTGHGKTAHWTSRALERAGFEITPSASQSDPKIDIISQNNTHTWQITRNGTLETHHTIYDTITALKKTIITQ